MSNGKIVILDLDNCISDDEWRISKIHWDAENPEERYDEYHSFCLYDKLANGHLFAEFDKVAILTGRPQKYLSETLMWLNKNELMTKVFHIAMRQPGDHSHSKELKQNQLRNLLRRNCISDDPFKEIYCAYDDRGDVVQMYKDNGVRAEQWKVHSTCAYTEPKKTARLEESLKAGKTASDILLEMAETFKLKNAIYRDNCDQVPELMKILFPNGVPSDLVVSKQFHLFELILVKLTRFTANERLDHVDSIHDAGVYCAMIESIIHNSGVNR